MPIHETAALAAALCWAFAGMVSAEPAQRLGAVRFNRLRLVMVFGMLAAWVVATGSWQSVGRSHLAPIVLSGFVGIFLGDTALFLTMNRLGPRRTGMLFSLNAPIAALLGWLVLDETLSPLALTGIGLTFAGVTLAIVFGKRRSQLHHWESVRGPLWIGVCLGLAAASSQAVGSLIARPVMAAGVDAVAASAIRIAIAALCLSLFLRLPLKSLHDGEPLSGRLVARVALSGLLGMAVGMTLILFALSGGKVGIVSTLSATTPAMILPLLWWRTGEIPAVGAWIGAALAILGSALIFSV